MGEIRLGDLVTYIAGTYIQIEDPRQLWIVIRVNKGSGTYTLMKYDGVDDIRCWHNRQRKIQDALVMAVRKEVFQTCLMEAELHEWFLQKGVGSAE